MESAGNAVIDFGRFCTGFLVVMGIGMNSPTSVFNKTVVTFRMLTPAIFSSTGSYGSLCSD